MQAVAHLASAGAECLLLQPIHPYAGTPVAGKVEQALSRRPPMASKIFQRAGHIPGVPWLVPGGGKSSVKQQQWQQRAVSQQAAVRNAAAVPVEMEDDLDIDFTLQDAADNTDDRLRSNARASTSSSRAWIESEGCGTEDGEGAHEQRRAALKASQFTWVGRNKHGSKGKSRGSSSSSSSSYKESSRHAGAPPRQQHAPAQKQQRSQGRKHQAPTALGEIDAPLLTKILNTCDSLDELYGLYFRHHHRFNHIHVSCAMNRLAWLRVSSPCTAAACLRLCTRH